MKNKNTINKILSVFIALLMIFSVSTVSEYLILIFKYLNKIYLNLYYRYFFILSFICNNFK